MTINLNRVRKELLNRNQGPWVLSPRQRRAARFQLTPETRALVRATVKEVVLGPNFCAEITERLNLAGVLTPRRLK